MKTEPTFSDSSSSLTSLTTSSNSSSPCYFNNSELKCLNRFSHSRNIVIPPSLYTSFHGNISSGSVSDIDSDIAEKDSSCIPWNVSPVLSNGSSGGNDVHYMKNDIDIDMTPFTNKWQRIAYYGERNSGTNLFKEYARTEMFGFKPIGVSNILFFFTQCRL
jgi:hypothetical protein